MAMELIRAIAQAGLRVFDRNDLVKIATSILIVLEDILFCFPLVSSPRKRESIK